MAGRLREQFEVADGKDLLGAALAAAGPSERAKSPAWPECSSCRYLPVSPVALPCGHMACQKCLDETGGNCPGCGRHAPPPHRPHVLTASLLSKIWPNQAHSADLCAQNQGRAAAFRHALDLDPGNHLAHAGLAKTASRPGEALKCMEAALRTQPFWAKGYEHKGALHLQLGQVKEACLDYLLALHLNPSMKRLKEELKQLFQLLRQPEEDDVAWVPTWRERSGSAGSLSSLSSNSDSDVEEDAHDWTCTSKTTNRGMEAILSTLNTFYLKAQELEDSSSMDKWTLERTSIVFDKKDFECSLCFRYFWQPVATPCGHTYCRTCIIRCLDHQPVCPLCKTSLETFQQEESFSISSFLDHALRLLLPVEYAERQKNYFEELEEFAKASRASQPVVPLFVCTMAYPTVPCPLHVFEPQYRHMIRQCLEANTHEFGMCPYMEDQKSGFPDYGTLLRIREMHYLPDGRALVNAVGTRRFHILRKGMKDGYHTGVVEFLQDVPPSSSEDLQRLKGLHDEVRKEAESWFLDLPEATKNQALLHFGPFPPSQEEELTSSDGPAWCWWLTALLPLSPRHLTALLALTSLEQRLQSFHHILAFFRHHNLPTPATSTPSLSS